ncbi:MAG: SurA N-terminal domain-containing protein [Verrucomicrobia bacterium]|nr:SurA N-terminal domain-containing protein [Verrucomicrobiota bacterium]
MLISKFNKLIRNRVVWAAFAFFVSISFVISFSTLGQGGGGNSSRSGSAAGTVFGSDISYQEFSRARTYTLSFRSGGIPDDLQEELNARVWERLVTTRTAKELGIQVATEEVQQRIARDPTFSENGNFDVNRYKAVVQGGLKVPEELFEDFYHETVVMEKFYAILASSTWIAPREFDDKLRDVTDSFNVEYAFFDREEFSTDLDLTDSDLQGVYDESSEIFRIPEQVRVKYVTFPYTNVDEALSFTDDEIKSFYDANQEFATVLATNISIQSIPLSESNTVEFTTTNVEEVVRPLEELHDAIVFRLQLDASRRVADDQSAEFLDLLLPPDGRPVPFEDAATQMGLEIRETGFFGRFDLQSDLNVGVRFNSEALALDAGDPQRAFSNPIEGDTAFYILHILDRKESYIPELDDVRDDVESLAEEKFMGEAFEKHVAARRDELKQAVKDGQRYADAATSMGAVVTTNVEFSLLDLSLGLEEPPEYLRDIMPGVLSWESGEISTSVPVLGGALLVYVSRRLATPVDSSASYRNSIARQLAREKTDMLIRAWGDYALIYGDVVPARGNEFASAGKTPKASSTDSPAEGSGN